MWSIFYYQMLLNMFIRTLISRILYKPFTSQCRRMVRHTLKILQQMLQDF